VSDKKPRDLERQLKKEPANLALRLQLAALYHQDGRTGDAVEQYRAVALAYRDDGRIQQAVAVARSALAVAPHDAELRRLVESASASIQAPAAVSTGVRVLDSAVAVRELAPMRPTGVVNAPRRRTGELSEPTPARTPSGLYTPTPLPVPLAYHEADPSKIRGLGTLLVDDDDDGGRGAAAGDGGDTIPESPTEGLHKAARRISEQLIAMSPGTPVAPLEGDDLSAELETRRRPKIDPRMLDHLGVPPTGRIAALPEVETEDEPTNPPASEPGFEPGRIKRAVARMDDDAWIEEPTDPRRDFGSDPDRPPSGVFDSPLGPTVAALAPDGGSLASPGGFGELPDVVRQRLVAAGEVRTLAPGTLLVREGEAGESLFVIESGEVRVLKRLAGRPPEIARLGAGAIVGEIAVMTDRRRHASVEAINEVRVIEIPRAAIAAAAEEHPVLAELLDNLVRERLLSNLMAVAPFFALLAADARAEVLARFRPRKVAAGAAVIEQGHAAHGLFLVVLGALELTVRRPDGRSVRVATVGEGGHVGELALMTDGPEPASARALGPAELVCLPARDFYMVVADDPTLWTSLRGEAERRSAEIMKALSQP
jgi:CRP-like cAMP-binding protein